MALNMLDYLLILVLFIGGVWGAFRGIFKVLVGLISLYTGLVVTLFFYKPLAAFFQELLPGLSISASQALAFGLIIVVFVNALSLLTRMVSTPPEERKRTDLTDVQDILVEEKRRKTVGIVGQVGGMLLGLVLTSIWMSLALGIIQYLLKVGGPVQGSGFRNLLATSAVVPMLNVLLFYFYLAVSIWVPGDSVPGIFTKIFQF